MGVKTMLPSYELGFYALTVTCAVLYSSSGIFEASRGNIPHHIPPGEIPDKEDECRAAAFTTINTSNRSLDLIFNRKHLENLLQG